MGKRWIGMGIDGRWHYHERHSDLEFGHWDQSDLHDQDGLEWVKAVYKTYRDQRRRNHVANYAIYMNGYLAQIAQVVHIIRSVETLHLPHQPETVSLSDPFLNTISHVTY